jgi:hypothetical protein
LYKHFQESTGEDSFENTLQIIGSLGKLQPKLIVDSVMVWRTSKNDSLLEGVDGLPEPLKQELIAKNPLLKGKDLDFLVRERRSIVSNFILCRVLTVILSQLNKDALPEDLGLKIEDMVFGQLSAADPEIISRYVNRMSNVEVFAKLAGCLSCLRFPTVSDRYLTEIKKFANIKEAKTEMLIRCMRYMKLKVRFSFRSLLYSMPSTYFSY